MVLIIKNNSSIDRRVANVTILSPGNTQCASFKLAHRTEIKMISTIR